MKGQPMHDPVDVSPMDVRGSVRVELFDDRTGKLVERQDGENFVSVMTKENMRWWQRMVFSSFSPGTAVADANGVTPYMMPRMPVEHLAYWSDTATEDPANEYRLSGEVVGWASRHPVGSPSGRRGVVDVSASVNGPGYSTWVFNWTTSQGNGTFQSVGWTRLVEANAMPIPRFPDPDVSDTTFTHNNTFSTANANRNGSGPGALTWDASDSTWVTFARRTSPSPNFYLLKFPEIGGNPTGTELAINNWTGALFNDNRLNDVAKLGNDWILVGPERGTTNGYIGRLPAAGGNLTWAAAIAPVTDSLVFYAVTIDGNGKIWTAANDGVMRRHDPANGSVEVSVTPWRTPSSLLGITYDADRDRFWISGTWEGQRGVACVQSDGTLDGPTFGFAGAQTVTASSPFASYVVPGVATFDPYYMVRNEATASTTSGRFIAPPAVPTQFNAGSAASTTGPGKYGGNLIYKGGTLYFVQGGPSGSGSTAGTGTFGFGASAIRLLSGHNLGTRVRLASPVTKTSAQNLRITYRFDFT